MSIDIWTASPFLVVAVAGLLVALRRRGASYGHLVCVAAFALYLAVVARWTVFPLRFDAEFADAMRRDTVLLDGVNLLPLWLAAPVDPGSEQVYGNLLMGMPFGFGLPFLVAWPARRVIAAAGLFALGIELVQLAIDVAYGFAYRSVDINDVLLVWAGAILGYAALRLVAVLYRRLAGDLPGDQGIWGHPHRVLVAAGARPGAQPAS